MYLVRLLSKSGQVVEKSALCSEKVWSTRLLAGPGPGVRVHFSFLPPQPVREPQFFTITPLILPNSGSDHNLP